MMVYVLSFVAFAFALAGLGVGRMVGRGGIVGTCGGLNTPDGCGVCGRGAEDGPCRRERQP